MARKRIKRKRKYSGYRYMEPYGSLHFALYWFDIDRINLDWNDKELIKRLWDWHGEKIMELWRKEDRPGERPKIWWHVHAKPEDFKIIGFREYDIAISFKSGKRTIKRIIFKSQYSYLKRNNLLEPWEVEKAEKDPSIRRLEENYLPFDYLVVKHL